MGVKLESCASVDETNADKIAQHADFFLVQDKGSDANNVRIVARGSTRTNRNRIGTRRQPGLKVGICGEHGGDPNSIEFCHEVDLDYVSCTVQNPSGEIGGRSSISR